VAAVAVAGVLAAACTSADRVGPLSARVATWAQATQLGPRLGAVLGDAGLVDLAVRRHQGTPVLHTVCAVLLDDAEAANSELPTPDSRLTTLLSDAYGAAGDAANDCYDAGASGTALLARSARERAQARDLLLRALARVKAVTGRAVPTTTTTGPGGII
jgi:hypothetical protein